MFPLEDKQVPIGLNRLSVNEEEPDSEEVEDLEVQRLSGKFRMLSKLRQD